ncbi:MAG: cyanoexosortase B system-associated protein [Trichodesmium sp.]
MVYSIKLFHKHQLSKGILLLFLLIILVVGAAPGYITGKWSWKNTPQFSNFRDLRQIREDGLTISELETISHRQLEIADHKWLLQTVKKDNQSVVLLILIPNGPRDQPQVEWMDINGFNRWKTDSYQRVKFTLETSDSDNGTGELEKQSANIEARFLRGWTNEQTYAVMQWYAWSGGGSPEPGDWFWTDRLAMISKKRVPWVAVSILFPIEPLADIDEYLPELKSIGQKIQVSLTKKAFQ